MANFEENKEYSFSLKSFRYRNNFAFCTVKTDADASLEILIGSSQDYPLQALLMAKQMGASVYGTFKGVHTHNGTDYPKFWGVSIG